MEKYMRTESGDIVEVSDRIRRALEDGLEEILGKVEYGKRIEDLVRLGDIVNGKRVEDNECLYEVRLGNIGVKELVTKEVYREVVYKVGEKK